MKCQKCGTNPATTHITEIVNGVKNETYLCSHCEKEYHNSTNFHSIFKSGFDSFFDGLWQPPMGLGHSSQNSVGVCPNCGSTISELQNRGRLGCSQCYNTFFDFLLPSVKKIHGSCNYTGKQPISKDGCNKKTDDINQLKQDLNHAVQEQNFEKAAILRDRIKEMEA